jgi:hypothetical protein
MPTIIISNNVNKVITGEDLVKRGFWKPFHRGIATETAEHTHQKLRSDDTK